VVVEVKHAEIGASPSQGIDGGMLGTGSLSAAPLHDLTLQAKAAFLLDLPAEAKAKFVEGEQKRMERQQEHKQYKDYMSRSSVEVQRKVLKSAELGPLFSVQSLKRCLQLDRSPRRMPWSKGLLMQ